MSFFAAFLAKLFEPLIEKIAASVVEKIKEWQKSEEIARIDKATQDAMKAKTDEERIKAAREMAEANRTL